MRKNLIIAAAICLFATTFAVSAQSGADGASGASGVSFAGDWTLDKDKSELGERSRVNSMTMKVTESDNELSYERKAEREAREGGGRGRGRGAGRGGGGNVGAVVFSLDGKETKVEAPGPRGGEVKLQAKKLDGGKLELWLTRTFEGRNGSMTLKTIETWDLSEDGKMLTVSSETETPRGKRESKMVFTKN